MTEFYDMAFSFVPSSFCYKCLHVSNVSNRYGDSTHGSYGNFYKRIVLDDHALLSSSLEDVYSMT